MRDAERIGRSAGAALAAAFLLGISGCADSPEEISPAEFIAMHSSLPLDLGSYDDEKRYEAIRLLQSQGRERGMAIAQLLLFDPKFENDRSEAVLARLLADWGDPRALPFLFSFLDHPDPFVAAVAGEGLLAFPTEPKVLEELERRLNHSSRDVRWRAVEVLRKLRNPRAVELCAERRRVETDPELRALLLVAIIDRKHPRRAEFLVEALQDPDPAQRRLAWNALLRYGEVPVRFDPAGEPSAQKDALEKLGLWARELAKEEQRP